MHVFENDNIIIFSNGMNSNGKTVKRINLGKINMYTKWDNYLY